MATSKAGMAAEAAMHNVGPTAESFVETLARNVESVEVMMPIEVAAKPAAPDKAVPIIEIGTIGIRVANPDVARIIALIGICQAGVADADVRIARCRGAACQGKYSRRDASGSRARYHLPLYH
jgi:hypothetical protein